LAIIGGFPLGEGFILVGREACFLGAEALPVDVTNGTVTGTATGVSNSLFTCEERAVYTAGYLPERHIYPGGRVVAIPGWVSLLPSPTVKRW